MLGHAVGWPVAAGGSQAIADAMASLPALARRRDPDRLRGRARSRELRGVAGRAVRPHAAAGRWPSPATSCPRATAARSARYRYGPGRLQARLRAGRPGALDGPGLPRAPGRVHLGGTLEEIAARRGRPSARAGTPSGPTCSSRSRACSTPAARRPGSTRCGPTATCPTARPSTPARPSRRQIERFAPGFRDLVRAAAPWAPPSWRRTTPTTSAATSTAARPTSASCSPGPVAAARAVHDARPALLHLLVVHAARRRRPRDVRLARGARGAARRLR